MRRSKLNHSSSSFSDLESIPITLIAVSDSPAESSRCERIENSIVKIILLSQKKGRPKLEDSFNEKIAA